MEYNHLLNLSLKKMTLEYFEENQPESPQKRSTVFEHAARVLNEGYKMDHDSINVWANLAYVMRGLPQSFERIKPRLHYGEYILESDRRNNEDRRFANFVMEKSDPAAIAAFDALVDEFNADLERIKKEMDYPRLLEFVEKAKKIVYSK